VSSVVRALLLSVWKTTNYGRIISANCRRRWKLFIPKFERNVHAKKRILNHHCYPLKFQRALCKYVRKKSGRIARRA
jgi:hypothetical protein